MKLVLSFLIFFVAIGMNTVVSAVVTVSDPLDRIIAVVNNDVITEIELDTEVSNIKKQLRQQNTKLPSDAVLKKQLLERMILRRIQLQMAERIHLRVDDEMLNRTLDNIAAQNNLSLNGLRESLERDGMDFSLFRENMRHEIIINQLQQRQVHNRISITKQEIVRFLKNLELRGGKSTEYHIGHILIAIPEAATSEQISQAKEKSSNIIKNLSEGVDFAQTAIAMSDGQQALEGGDVGWRRFEALPTLFSDWVNKQTVGEVSHPIRSPSGFHIIKLLGKRDNEEQHVVTQTHARHILIRTDEFSSNNEARNRIVKLRERILAGEDFAKLAKAHSDDPGSSTNGGDLGWVNPGEMVPPFEQAYKELNKNQLSDPVQTRFGWHIIEVLGTRTRDNTESVKHKKAKDTIRARKIEPALQNWLRRLRSEAFVENRL
jgi:peptidyl-prolyl cis-trans isomerase SurA